MHSSLRGEICHQRRFKSRSRRVNRDCKGYVEAGYGDRQTSRLKILLVKSSKYICCRVGHFVFPED